MTKNNVDATHSWGIASLVLGILSFILLIAPYIAIFLAIAAVVFYNIQKKHEPTGVAQAGLVIGILGIILNTIILLILVLVLGFAGSSDSSALNDDVTIQPTETVYNSDPVIEPSNEEEIDSAKIQPSETVYNANPVIDPPKEEDIDSATMGEKNSLKKALSYLDYTAFSYSGLIKQLEFEGFSREEATYGADNCGANWNEQAALKAQSYLDYTAFSRNGLIKQLEFEGFTREQAEYGVEAVGY